MTQNMLASRVFGPGDQQRFAALTGDCNPVHMDPVAARRTQAGAPVVHGVHALLWMLDSIAAHYAGLPPIATLNARFLKVIYLGDVADLVVTKRDADALTAEVTAGGNVTLRLSVIFGPAERAPVAAHWDGRPAALQPASALDLTIELMASMHGHVAFAQPIEEIASAFPGA